MLVAEVVRPDQGSVNVVDQSGEPGIPEVQGACGLSTRAIA
ncbi:hypothetical protein [Nocardia sp. NRRL S-836]|nr:hypothetical protein [Nocardia sp. NRRL S-836]